MGHYLDGQKSWSWAVDQSNKTATITTDHGSHTHTLDLSKVSIGEIADNPSQVLGDAHRATTHDYKDGSKRGSKHSKSNPTAKNSKNAKNTKTNSVTASSVRIGGKSGGKGGSSKGGGKGSSGGKNGGGHGR